MRLKDPTVYFLLLGGVVFFAFKLFAEPDTFDEQIYLSGAQEAQLKAAFERVWQRRPNSAETDRLVDDWVREEVASREAIRLRLDRNDPIVRRRMRQKFEAYVDQLSVELSPTDEQLGAWFQAHGEDYREPQRFSLQQIFFSSDRRADAAADALTLLRQIENGEIATGGDTASLPKHIRLTSEAKLTDLFGRAFVEGLDTLVLDAWGGPIPSAFGMHLVLLERRTPSEIPDLGSVYDEVLRDYLEDARQQARDQRYSALMDRYSLIRESETP
ncbi:MAG: peptidylprolyl isomerase [Pseudomonadota bacterium]